VIIRAQRGDREAFAALFEQYKNLVYKTAYLMLGDSSEAEDVLQEVFVQVYKSLSGFDPRKAAFSTWLYRVTMNYCLNHNRKKRHLALPLDEVSALLRNEFPGSQLAEEEALQQAVGKLTDKQRAVVILRYFWDLPYADIAQSLGLPLGTVKSRLDLALKTLRNILEEQEPGKDSISQTEVCE
ncbi:MAG TPA: RNA polymerase sigma factor, partial [Anaerolineales bacterium]|nr:RNA polymerase sigma factor [Anaerolineales bacterium]